MQADADLEAETGALTSQCECATADHVRALGYGRGRRCSGRRVVVQWKEGGVAGAERWWWKRLSEGGD